MEWNIKDPRALESTLSPRLLPAAHDLRSSMQGSVILNGDEGYFVAMQTWIASVHHQPAIFALCETVEDVQAAVNIAREHGIPLSVRGGGHDWAGRSLCHDGLVIDLTRMRNVSIDTSARIAKVQGGATAFDVVEAASKQNLIAVTGAGGTVGMAGLTLGGGYGPLTPRYGLALDNLIRVEIVLANGKHVYASASKNSDLFWALLGGGGNFGVVTSMNVHLHSTGNPLSGVIVYPWIQAESVLRGYADIMMSAPDELAVTACVFTKPDGTPAISLIPTWCGEQNHGEQVIAQLQQLGTPIKSSVGPTSYASMLRASDALFESTRRCVIETRWQAAVTPASITAIIEAARRSPSAQSVITVQSFHGAPTKIPLESTAFGLRERHFLLLIVGAWAQDARDGGQAAREWANDLSQVLAPHSLPGGYANLLGPNHYDQISSAYGSNGARLNGLKTQFDPEGLFTSALRLPR